VTVSGVNLGKVTTDLQVTVADSVCTVIDDDYVPSQRCGIIFHCCYFSDTVCIEVSK